LKPVNRRCHYNLRKKNSFTVLRVTNAWNSLAESVILADTIDTFQNQLGKFWKNQDMLSELATEV